MEAVWPVVPWFSVPYWLWKLFGLWYSGSLYLTTMEKLWPMVYSGSLYLTDYESCEVCGPLILCTLMTMEVVWPVVPWFSVPYWLWKLCDLRSPGSLYLTDFESYLARGPGVLCTFLLNCGKYQCKRPGILILHILLCEGLWLVFLVALQYYADGGSCVACGYLDSKRYISS